MTAIYLYDDARARRFEPFALTRPASTLVAGVAPIHQRWATALQLPAECFVGAPQLADFDEQGAPCAASGTIPAGSVVANSRFVPRLEAGGPTGPGDWRTPRAGEAPVDLWRSEGRVVAVRLARALPVEALAGGARGLDALEPGGNGAAELAGWWIDEVWDLVRHLPAMLAADITFLAQEPVGPSTARPVRPEGAIVLGDHPVLVAPDAYAGASLVRRGATIEPHVVLDASAGPIYIGAESHVHAFTRLVGPCYVGRKATVLGGDVTACSIGDVCKVRGEVSTSIFAGYANKGHDGFVGHSYLGRWVNLGAGTVTSNLKNTYGTVALWTPDGVRDTGLQFLGTLFGDHAKTGIGLRLTTGTVLGAGANVYDRMPPKAVAPFSWGGGAPYASYRRDKFLEVAERVMARRQVALTERGARQLGAAYDARWTVESEVE